jgi:hypothetical protein
MVHVPAALAVAMASATSLEYVELLHYGQRKG